MSDRPIVHLFCNAHIDPIWMWPWEEGAREAISTFRTAADLLDEFPEFVFNHNESLLYEWVEEYDPPLFERIRAHVRAGRWNITGGWYLQPDCNLPGGETLIRTMLEGRRYFAEKFGVRPPVAYNFDSFGHPGSLPGLLRSAGFELYVHCRPTESQMSLPGPVYRWQGVDGAEVIAIRPDTGWYCTPGPDQAQQQARNGIAAARATGLDQLVTWGLGDHGGGPTRHDLLKFREMIAEMREADIEVRHSTPEAYLARIKPHVSKLPTHRGELQRTLSGCYTSVAPIKRQMREGEALLASAERWAAIAWWRYGWPYPAAALAEAWKRLMLNTFHDVLCGSLLESALVGVEDMYGYAHDVARRIVVKAQHAMLPHIPPTPDTIPIYVLNPHAAAMRAPVNLNFLSAYIVPPEVPVFALYDDAGRLVASQTGGGPAALADPGRWQPHVEFVADVPPLAARRYEIRFEAADLLANPDRPLHVKEDEAGIVVENAWWTARFSRSDGALISLVSRQTGVELLRGPIRFFAMRDTAHAWGGESVYVYNEPVAPFAPLSADEVGVFAGMEGQPGPAVRVIWRPGPVSITVECLTRWQHTRASARFTFYADLPFIDIDTRLYMQARRKMIKLAFPFDLPGVRAVCEVPYGAAERAADATEWPYARWLRLETPAMNVGLANSGQNGFDVSPDGLLHLSISRGGVYCSWDEGQGLDPCKTYDFMDQERVDTRFRLLAGADRAAVAGALIPAALELNQPLERFFVYHPPSHPPGAPAQPLPFLSVAPSTVTLAALKKADAGEALIVRLAETVGQPTTAHVSLEGTSPFALDFGPFEIKTFRVWRRDDGVSWSACDLIET